MIARDPVTDHMEKEGHSISPEEGTVKGPVNKKTPVAEIYLPGVNPDNPTSPPSFLSLQ
jgi:hypothetical protein